MSAAQRPVACRESLAYLQRGDLDMMDNEHGQRRHGFGAHAQTHAPAVEDIASVRVQLLPFWSWNPAVWLAQMEAVFNLQRITCALFSFWTALFSCCSTGDNTVVHCGVYNLGKYSYTVKPRYNKLHFNEIPSVMKWFSFF